MDSLGCPLRSIIEGFYCIGIASGTTFSVCKACNISECSQAALESCCKWAACPDESTCANAPDAVSCSWGGTDIVGAMSTANDWMDSYFDLFEDGDIYVAMAAGNSNTGLTCGGASYPGNSVHACAVGSTDANDQVSDFSCRGPTLPTLIAGKVKPDLVAPGENIYGAWIDGSNSDATLTGTSMATPMIAACALLIKSACPALNRDEIQDVMCKGAVRLTGTCDFLASFFYGIDRPNIDAGCGRPDLVKIFSVLCSLAKCESLKPLCQ